ncbi:prolipoprotein diacylglyceryl transferase [Sinomonas sp. JGH33]|uniref:Phosphatidylglycerol--prolipoprotein diacylglyceryl transferase n=1 Tax=Sinomonas terricola TaxID=3110330 RepID=A0ABU5T457_9MICC|nr:prolipoprotein diacylglyceryl transferase [Sinomonas sp. JGH33]MEA5454332.1 prolipoprotein diacylglyceryl transferase [Sinomonas sp. JGH33]
MTFAVRAGALAPAAIPAPGWSGFDIPLPWGALRIHAYALCILLGIVVALWLTTRRWKARGGSVDAIWDIAIWAIPAGIIGGRLYHVFSSPDRYFGPGYNGTGDLWAIPRIWEGGLGIWGAVVLGAAGAWIGCRRAGVRLTAFMDAAAPGLLLAQAIGRWGNYFNQELFGGPTTLPWGLEVDPSSPNFPAGYAVGTLFHPTFLYECVWNLVGVVLLVLLDRRFRFRGGRLFWVYAAYYTLGRVWIEALRIDAAQQITLFGVTARLNVWTSIVVFLASVLVLLVLSVRRGRETDGVWAAGREPREADEGDATGDARAATAIQHSDSSVSEYGDRGKVTSHRAALDDPRPASQDASDSAEDDGK